MARTRTDIEDRYRNDLEAAESFRDVDPGRYAELVNAAKDRRYAFLEEEIGERETAARTAQMDATRARVAAMFPLADPKLVTGNTPEELEASAKALSDFAKKNRDEADAAARGASRAARASIYDRGGVPTSPPQQGPRGADREQLEAAAEAKAANDALRAQSGVPGDRRDATLIPSEEQVLANIRRSGRAAALSMEGFKARNEGTAVFVESTPQSEKLRAEDARG